MLNPKKYMNDNSTQILKDLLSINCHQSRSDKPHEYIRCDKHQYLYLYGYICHGCHRDKKEADKIFKSRVKDLLIEVKDSYELSELIDVIIANDEAAKEYKEDPDFDGLRYRLFFNLIMQYCPDWIKDQIKRLSGDDFFQSID